MNLDNDTMEENTQTMLSHINVGTGQDCTIREMAETVAKVIGYTGGVAFDSSKPDGVPRKLLDVSRLKSWGWQSSTTLEESLQITYDWFLKNQDKFKWVIKREAH